MAKHTRTFLAWYAEVSSRIVEGKVKYPSAMSPDAKDIISKLCHVHPSRRLGNLRGGAADVKNHPWFKDIDWERMYNRQLEAPIKPHVSCSTDTRNFEDYDNEPERRVAYSTDMRKKYDHCFESF